MSANSLYHSLQCFIWLRKWSISWLSQRDFTSTITATDVSHNATSISITSCPSSVSLAIGKGGYNIKLASKLAGYDIDIFRDDVAEEEDVDLDEFKDEFDDWVIEAFKKIGCDTAKNVLAIERNELVQRTDLEEETVDEVLASIRKELEIE